MFVEQLIIRTECRFVKKRAPSERTASICGAAKEAAAPTPSAHITLPLPARVLTAPVGVTART